jgi:hypothetical protein
VNVDIRFNAIERCMEDILDGKDATLYLDDALDHVLDRKLLDIVAHGITVAVEEHRSAD